MKKRLPMLIIICLLVLPALCIAQSGGGLLEKEITLPEKNISLQSLLDNITKRYGISFAYEPGVIPGDMIMRFSKEKMLMKEVLGEISKKADVNYVVRSKVVILRKNASPRPAGEKKEIKTSRSTISGFVKDINSGENLVRATVSVLDLRTGELTNSYGFYSLTLPEGAHRVSFSCAGYETQEKDIVITGNSRIDIELSPAIGQLQEVVVGRRQDNLAKIEQRLSGVNLQYVKELPSLFGESDVVRSMQLLPGVTSVAEAGGGFQVRGGAWDQNLILLDEAIVYNANHMYGVYSVFNPDIIQDIKFYKGGIPASYGGRSSSVMDIRQKNGNMKSYHGSAGIGLISSRFTFEGPIQKDKSSFIVAFRRPYIDLFFKHIGNDDLRKLKTHFYDINSKLNYILNDNNRIYLSLYAGNDKTKDPPDNLAYGNITGTLRYNHVFSKQLFSNTSLIYSRYRMSVGETDHAWGWKNRLGLDHYEIKNNFTLYLARHTLDFGLQGISYKFYPGDLKPVGDSSKIIRINIPSEYAAEYAAYLSDQCQLSNKIAIQYGVRFSGYRTMGPGNVYLYDNNFPKDPATITDTVSYKRNKTIKTYSNIEPRISVKYTFRDKHSIKLSYNRTAQYIQQISNSVNPLPYDMWKQSGTYIKPLVSDQFSAGYFTDIPDKSIELSVEVYYRSLENLLDVKPGTDVSLNNTIDAGLLQGIGRAYGIEMMVNKTRGRLTGMISYTWSKTERKVAGRFREETINAGRYYPADYDMPHKITLAGQYRLNKRSSLTTDFIYLSGRPVTYPSGQYLFFNTLLPYYGSKNGYRLPAFHRLDVGAVVKGKEKINHKWEGYWTFSIYNLYARKNASLIYISRRDNSQDTEAIKFWFFSVVPAISYSIKF